MPHHFDALWNGATAPIAVGQRGPLKFSALAKATAATATVATALFAAGSADLATTARQLAPGRDALVLTVWHPFDVGFVPAGGVRFDAAQIADVRAAARAVATAHRDAPMTMRVEAAPRAAKSS